MTAGELGVKATEKATECLPVPPVPSGEGLGFAGVGVGRLASQRWVKLHDVI